MRLKSFLILSLIVLASCKSHEVPLERLTILDVIEGEGTVFKIIDKKKLTVAKDPIARLPLIEMQGYVCLSPDEYLELKYWIIEQIERVDRTQRPAEPLY